MLITEIKGIGKKNQELLNKLGIFQVEDLLEYYPRTYDTFEEPVFVNNTPVSDKAGHGIGIRSIISVIEKYNGVYDFFTEDGVFYFQACM